MAVYPSWKQAGQQMQRSDCVTILKDTVFYEEAGPLYLKSQFPLV